MAQLYMARQMEAVVLKNHVALTADRAWLVRKHNPGIKAFGGVTLNGAAGGINPEAVQWMWRMQGGYGRVVWPGAAGSAEGLRSAEARVVHWPRLADRSARHRRGRARCWL